MPEISTFLVRGPASRLPRGYLWVLPFWFVVLAAAPLLVAHLLTSAMPWWLAAGQAGCVLIAGLVVIGTLATVRRHALRIGPTGIFLGVATTRKKPGMRQVHLPWHHIAQLRLAERRYGMRMMIIVGQGSLGTEQPSRARQALTLMGCLAMPFGVGRGHPAMTTARMEPPRFMIKVCDVTMAEMREVIRAVKPADVAVLTAVRHVTLRRPTSHGRLPRLRRSPPAPVGSQP
jgi:hypothetical protein